MDENSQTSCWATLKFQQPQQSKNPTGSETFDHPRSLDWARATYSDIQSMLEAKGRRGKMLTVFMCVFVCSQLAVASPSPPSVSTTRVNQSGSTTIRSGRNHVRKYLRTAEGQVAKQILEPKCPKSILESLMHQGLMRTNKHPAGKEPTPNLFGIQNQLTVVKVTHLGKRRLHHCDNHVRHSQSIDFESFWSKCH